MGVLPGWEEVGQMLERSRRWDGEDLFVVMMRSHVDCEMENVEEKSRVLLLRKRSNS